MPPRKEVKSLFDLSLSAARDLVVSSVNRITELYPCEMGCNFDVEGCKETVKSIQGFLRDLLPQTVWEPLFYDVCNEISEREWGAYVTDQRIVASIFIFDNVSIKKLALTQRDISDRDELNVRYVEFWLETAPMLRKLVEADLSHVYNVDVILAFARNCTELKYLRIPDLKPELLREVLSPCTKLLSLDGNLVGNQLEDFFMTLDKDLKLKLRNLTICSISPESVYFALDRCPDLTEIVCSHPNGNLGTLLLLTTSPHKFTRLTLWYEDDFSPLYHNLFSCKGAYITNLVISFGAGHPMKFLHIISETCQNLRKLSIKSYCQQEDQTAEPNYLVPNLSFPRLEFLKYSSTCRCIHMAIQLITMVKLCLADSNELTVLKMPGLTFYDEDKPEVEAALTQLFISTNERMRQLKKLVLAFSYGRMSANLGRTVYESCPNLTSLVIGYMDEDGEAYFDQLKNEVKRNNLDLHLDYKVSDKYY